ncbi:hypothetical protein ABT215_04135 [Streptomyces sp900105755]|uniref:hypothetical protein n=1 Tax=Streptomyces sp. 900105755 TaxID=3154389 RepID=UPI00332E8D5A
MRVWKRLRSLRIPKPARPRRTLTDVMDVAGVGCLVGAAWWWQPIIGLVALGVALIAIGWAVGE